MTARKKRTGKVAPEPFPFAFPTFSMPLFKGHKEVTLIFNTHSGAKSILDIVGWSQHDLMGAACLAGR